MSKKNAEQKTGRKQFVSLAINSPKEAAKVLCQKAKGLENCRTTMDSVYALQDILYLSEVTIFRDLSA